MMKIISKRFLALTVAVGLNGAGAFAQTADQPAQDDVPTFAQDSMQDMMGGETQGGDMNGMMNMMAQMNEMMGACTKMMQAMDSGESAPGQPEEQSNPG